MAPAVKTRISHFRADAAGGEVGDATVGAAKAGVASPRRASKRMPTA